MRLCYWRGPDLGSEAAMSNEVANWEGRGTRQSRVPRAAIGVLVKVMKTSYKSLYMTNSSVLGAYAAGEATKREAIAIVEGDTRIPLSWMGSSPLLPLAPQ
jgi:hypothetical protein